MESSRSDNALSPRAARAFGGLLLWAFVAYGGGDSWMVALRSKHLSSFGPEGAREVVSAGLLLLSNSVVVVLLGALLFPLLWHHGGPGLAAGYLATRLAEALLLAAGVVAQLLLVPLAALGGDVSSSASGSTGAMTAAGGGGSITRADLAALAIKSNFFSLQIAMLILGLGSLPVCLLLLRRQLLPAWMAVWGLVGYSLLAAGSVAELYGVGGVGVPLAIPGGLWEMALGLWLLGRGGFLPGQVGAGGGGSKKQA